MRCVGFESNWRSMDSNRPVSVPAVISFSRIAASIGAREKSDISYG